MQYRVVAVAVHVELPRIRRGPSEREDSECDGLESRD